MTGASRKPAVSLAGTVYAQFREAALHVPDLPFLAYPRSSTRGYLGEGASFSYGEALARIDALAEDYRRAGYRAGHRVAFVLGNRPEHFWHLFALNRIGASCVLLNPDYLPHEMAFGMEFPGAALVVSAPPQLGALRPVAAGLGVAVHDATGSGPIPGPARQVIAAQAAPPAREALVIYTSGTTGNPKGCMISNYACLASGEFYATAGGLMAFRTGEDRLYAPFPTFHMSISVFALNTITRLRNCLVLQDRFHLSTWWSDIVETQATCVHYLGIVPPLLVKTPPSELEKRHRVRFGQGAGVDPVVRAAFEARFGFPLIEGWGMTETSRAIHNCREPRSLAGRAFGRPRHPLEVSVVDDGDRPVPFGTPGELLVRCAGPDPRSGFFSGYVNQPEETEKAWRNGWFHTGDVVTQDADGMLYFVERRKNIIRRSGENIAAGAVEDALIDHSGVRSVAVMAVPDEFHDEEVLACVVLEDGVPATESTAIAILDHARARLAHHKLPAWMAFVDAIPVTGTQKVRKGAIFDEKTDPRQDPRTVDLRHRKRRASGKAPVSLSNH